MINKKNIWFMTLFSLVLVLSVYYVTMPSELLVSNNSNVIDEVDIDIEEGNIIDVLREEDDSVLMEEIDKLKMTIGGGDISIEDKNSAFDQIKLLNQISSMESLLEEKIKNNYDIEGFVKIEGNNIRVVIDSDEHDNGIVNNIMRLIQSNFEEKKYITVQVK